MQIAKGNHVQNWNDSFEKLTISYSEELSTPAALSNFVQYNNVFNDIKAYCAEAPKVLEVGCGGARSSLFLARRGVDVTCADFAPEALRLAKQNFSHFGAKGTFVQDDILNTKLEKGSYDCVMSFGLLEHFEEIDPIIQNMGSLLKPGGIHVHAIIPKKFSTQVVADVLLYPFRFVKNVAKGQFSGIFTRSFRDFPHYENAYTPDEYCEAFRRSGSEILRCEASGTAYPFIALPMGLGNIIVSLASRPLLKVFSWIDRKESRFLLKISPCFYIVARKKQ
jgi:2-polyprenyl-3-methyl-5-hydroxy-6-metoxy-1,4-benzoquinol methylase